jgi:hypothetical protein
MPGSSISTTSASTRLIAAADLEGCLEDGAGRQDAVGPDRHLANRVSGHREDIVAEHEAIVAALDRKDEKAAMKAMTAHLRSVFNAIARLQAAS